MQPTIFTSHCRETSPLTHTPTPSHTLEELYNNDGMIAAVQQEVGSKVLRLVCQI